jgi:hypothetical protein
MNDLDRVRDIFLSDVDEDTRKENEEQIRQWETALIQHQAFAGWQSNDISLQIVKQAKETYKDISLQLASNRTLTDAQRNSLWAKQDACLFLLSLIEKDAKGALEQIHREIRAAL